MKQTTDQAVRNLVEEDLAVWDNIQAKHVQRHGRETLHDPEFLTARRDIYKDIYDRHKNKPLSLAEKAEMRIIRSQRKSMLREIREQRRAMLRRRYPNPFVRLARNALVLAFNISLLLAKMAWAAVKSPLNVLLRQLNGPSQDNNRIRQYQTRERTRNEARKKTQQQNGQRRTTSNTKSQDAHQQSVRPSQQWAKRKSFAGTTTPQQAVNGQQAQNGSAKGHTTIRKIPGKNRMVMPVTGKGLKK